MNWRRKTVRLAAARSPCFSSRRLASGCSRVGETNVHGIVLTESMLPRSSPARPGRRSSTHSARPPPPRRINGEAFYYVSQTTSRPVAFLQPHEVDRTVFVVYFDKGKVTRIANYGMKDGKVFDFVHRTTPTAGADLNFLSQLIRGLGKGIPGFGRWNEPPGPADDAQGSSVLAGKRRP